jgi:hypothetical protein
VQERLTLGNNLIGLEHNMGNQQITIAARKAHADSLTAESYEAWLERAKLSGKYWNASVDTLPPSSLTLKGAE